MKLIDRVVAYNTILETYEIEQDYNLLLYFNRHNYKEIKRTYYKDGKTHKDDGPAYIMRYPNGEIKEERYFIDDKLHRINGPSHISWRFCDGDNENVLWYYDNINYSYEVENWLKNNNMNWKEMNDTDYNRMWFEIL